MLNLWRVHAQTCLLKTLCFKKALIRVLRRGTCQLTLTGAAICMVLSCLCKEMNLTDTDNAESQELSCHRVGDVVNELSASDQPLFNTIIRSRLGLDIAAYLDIPLSALATDPVSASRERTMRSPDMSCRMGMCLQRRPKMAKVDGKNASMIVM